MAPAGRRHRDCLTSRNPRNAQGFAIRHAQDARLLFRDVEPWLPAVGRRNILGSWLALSSSVPGLILTDDVVRCGALYPSCVSYLGTGTMVEWPSIDPRSPQIVAGIAAHAAATRPRARPFRNRDPSGRHAAAPAAPTHSALLVRTVAGRRSASGRTGARSRDDRGRGDRLPLARNGHLRESGRTVPAAVIACRWLI
jgi:hypothetical protein